MWLEVACGVVTLVFVLCALVYGYITRKFSIFDNIGIPYVKPKFPYGSYNIFKQDRHLFDHLKDGYNKYRDEKVFGWFLMGKPVYNVNDVDILKQVGVCLCVCVCVCV